MSDDIKKQSMPKEFEFLSSPNVQKQLQAVKDDPDGKYSADEIRIMMASQAVADQIGQDKLDDKLMASLIEYMKKLNLVSGDANMAQEGEEEVEGEEEGNEVGEEAEDEEKEEIPEQESPEGEEGEEQKVEDEKRGMEDEEVPEEESQEGEFPTEEESQEGEVPTEEEGEYPEQEEEEYPEQEGYGQESEYPTEEGVPEEGQPPQGMPMEEDKTERVIRRALRIVEALLREE